MTLRTRTLAINEFLRFTAVALIGLAVDLCVAWLFAVPFGVVLWIAALVGFLCGAVVNYFLHEKWTFREGARRLSVRRSSVYFGALAVTLFVRLTTIALLQLVYTPSGNELFILIAATSISFFANYTLSKFVVFKSKPTRSSSIRKTPMNDVIDIEKYLNSEMSDWDVPQYDTTVFSEKQNLHVLVIPVINEGDRIQAQILRIQEIALPIDVIIADGGSTDGALNLEFLNKSGVRALLTKTDSGRLSAQLRMAYSWCIQEGYEGIVTIDGNGKDGVEAIAEISARLKEGYDYIQGSRYMKGGVAENTPLERSIGNRLMHAPLLSLAGRTWLSDTTNGFRGYSTKYLLHPKVKPFRDVFQNYELLFYLTVRAGQIGLRVKQVPVRRSYPVNEPVPTKISGMRGMLDLLSQTIGAAIGLYKP